MAGTKPFTASVRREFLEHLKHTANVTEAARRVNISRGRMYDLRRKDPLLAKGWEEALAATTDRLEAEAIRRAVEGVEKPYFYQGKECGATREYSDALMKFLLQKRLPDRYGDGGGQGASGMDGESRDPGRVVFEMHLGMEGSVKECVDRGQDDPDLDDRDQAARNQGPSRKQGIPSRDNPDHDKCNQAAPTRRKSRG